MPTTSVSELTAPVPGTLLDVREDDEWHAGHAVGAVHIPLGELPVNVAGGMGAWSEAGRPMEAVGDAAPFVR